MRITEGAVLSTWTGSVNPAGAGVLSGASEDSPFDNLGYSRGGRDQPLRDLCAGRN